MFGALVGFGGLSFGVWGIVRGYENLPRELRKLDASTKNGLAIEAAQGGLTGERIVSRYSDFSSADRHEIQVDLEHQDATEANRARMAAFAQ